MIKKSELRQVVHGPYVATPIPNAYNDKVAYWLSKVGCTLSLYMFTVNCGMVKSELKEKLSKDGIAPYVIMLEEQMVRKRDVDLYMELCKVQNSGFDWVNGNIYNEAVRLREYGAVLTCLTSMSADAEHDGNWTWGQIGEFTHYYDKDRLQEIMEYLRENGYISYIILKKGVKELRVLKQM